MWLDSSPTINEDNIIVQPMHRHNRQGSNKDWRKGSQLESFAMMPQPILALSLIAVQSNDSKDHIVSWVWSHGSELTRCSFGEPKRVLLIFHQVSAKTCIRYRTCHETCQGRCDSALNSADASNLVAHLPVFQLTWLGMTNHPPKIIHYFGWMQLRHSILMTCFYVDAL